MKVVSILFMILITGCSYSSVKRHKDLERSCPDLAPGPEDLSTSARYTYEKETSRWLKRPAGKSSPILFVIHGLNNRPDNMDRLAMDLASEEDGVFRLGLSGHRGSLEEMKHLDHSWWQSDVYRGYCLIKNGHPDSPVILVANSLGAAAAYSTAIHSPADPLRFDKEVLFAPALAVKNFTWLIRLAGFLGREFVIPSWAPKDFKANNGTTNAAYQALFQMIKDVQGSAGNLLAPHPRLIVMDPEDELVNLEKLKYFFRKRKLPIELILVNNDHSPMEEKYHHLVMHPDGLGERLWMETMTRVKEFLKR